MQILELRILPPMAIGRLGSSSTPLAAYNLEPVSLNPPPPPAPPAPALPPPLGFRKIVPMPTYTVDSMGNATSHTPVKINFKESAEGKIFPVAPFLEVWAVTDANPSELVPLTEALLVSAGHTLDDVSWNVEVGNIKIFRRTGDSNDRIYSRLSGINDHAVHQLSGECANFLPGKTLPLGSIQYIKPSPAWPGIRLRFTPAAGKVYGSSRVRAQNSGNPDHPAPVIENDPVIISDDQVIYDETKPWRGYTEVAAGSPLYTVPGAIYAGYTDNSGNRVSWGYVDDECDGNVIVFLKGNSNTLTARAHISAGPPAFAPDTLPIRVVSDELEQIILGTNDDGLAQTDADNVANEILFRAYETVRLTNTSIMNGNPYTGSIDGSNVANLSDIASTMARQDTGDFGRAFEPIMPPGKTDQATVLGFHSSNMMQGSSFSVNPILRRPTEIGDLSSSPFSMPDFSGSGRQKMPAMMRGADGRALALPLRLINSTKTNKNASPVVTPVQPAGTIAKDDLVAHINYLAQGNPYGTLPRTAISNCFPGLELDFRGLWRRAFKGITLTENNNLVTSAADYYPQLKGCRLLAVDGRPTMVRTYGPTTIGGPNLALTPSNNPNGVSFMEWSNSLVHVLQKQGQEVSCVFTKFPCNTEVFITPDEIANGDNIKYQVVTLTVNNMFDGNTAALANDIFRPGEMTQSLCAPWQNDYRECTCYYWAASRPDFVNVVPAPDQNSLSTGDIWTAKVRTGNYIADDRVDDRLWSYDDLFRNWEGELQFILGGYDEKFDS